MPDFIGLVKKVHIKDGGGTGGKKAWKKYSLCVAVDGGDDTWVNAGFNKAPKGPDGTYVEEGHRVKFSAEEGEYGLDVKGTITISAAPKAVAAPPAGNKGGGKSNYVDRNTSIVIQSARKDALQLIELAVATDSLPVPKGKSAGDRVNRFNLICDYVDKLTVRFAHDLIADISEDEFRVFGAVQDSFGEGVATPLPDPAAEAPADAEVPAEEAPEPETSDDNF